ncbi:MAG: serine protease [Clostridia bacterium]|nr:serine protease [Clostridia bacterium]
MSRVKLTLFLVIVFTLLTSTMAWAYSPYDRYNSNYNYNYNYSNYWNYYSNWNFNNWFNNWNNYNPQPTPKPQPQPEPTPQPEPEPAQPAPVHGLSSDEQKIVDLVNQERVSRGLKPLQVDMDLVKLARMKSQDMVDNNYFSHTSPTYGSPFQMMKDNGVSYRTAGENLAGAPNVNTAHTNLMNSDGHRANILNPDYTHIGIGIVKGSKYGQIYTQLFVGR